MRKLYLIFSLTVSALLGSVEIVDLFYLNEDVLGYKSHRDHIPRSPPLDTPPPTEGEGEDADAGKNREKLGRWGRNLVQG